MPIIALPFLAATIAAPAVAEDTCFSGLVAFDGSAPTHYAIALPPAQTAQVKLPGGALLHLRSPDPAVPGSVAFSELRATDGRVLHTAHTTASDVRAAYRVHNGVATRHSWATEDASQCSPIAHDEPKVAGAPE